MRLSKWGKDKNIKPQEMKAIVRKQQKRKLIETDKQGLQFSIRGNTVEESKVVRWMKSHGIPESSLYAPSPAACKSSSTGYLIYKLANILQQRHLPLGVGQFLNKVPQCQMQHILQQVQVYQSQV
jgi:hypothetical protein